MELLIENRKKTCVLVTHNEEIIHSPWVHTIVHVDRGVVKTEVVSDREVTSANFNNTNTDMPIGCPSEPDIGPDPNPSLSGPLTMRPGLALTPHLSRTSRTVVAISARKEYVSGSAGSDIQGVLVGADLGGRAEAEVSDSQSAAQTAIQVKHLSMTFEKASMEELPGEANEKGMCNQKQRAKG